MASEELIANELLAFIQNVLNDGVMDEISIRQICRTGFKEEEICSGKALLFQSIGKADQMPPRRRDGGVKSLQDIIEVFRNSDPDDMPVFAAKQLSKLPPVSFDHVDVTHVYVSRLHDSTKSEEIVEYVRVKTKFTLRVERLEPRISVNFSSFVVRVPTEHLSTFTKEEFWPKGVVFRRFRGSINSDSRVRLMTKK